jgi:hypothetical protein
MHINQYIHIHTLQDRHKSPSKITRNHLHTHTNALIHQRQHARSSQKNLRGGRIPLWFQGTSESPITAQGSVKMISHADRLWWVYVLFMCECYLDKHR